MINMAVSRSQLMGKQVYNPDGELVGEVVDVSFTIGEVKIVLIVKGKWGGEIDIPWENVMAAKDIVILKEPVEIPKVPEVTSAVTPTSTPAAPVEEKKKKGFKLPLLKKEEPEEAKICPFCGKPATWISQYKRWYCYNCQKYID
ncbi:MAG: hypothetical protein DRJ39_00795 [Thermoprotei archaeon]|nr:MAG: hypothetical protein DRJ39_00795 [Thermoprotei archaeon]